MLAESIRPSLLRFFVNESDSALYALLAMSTILVTNASVPPCPLAISCVILLVFIKKCCFWFLHPYAVVRFGANALLSVSVLVSVG